MSNGQIKLTVLFEKPFWIGVFERSENGFLSVSRVVFGAEPKDSEIYNFIQAHFSTLTFSPAVSIVEKEEKRNPKRVQREVRKQMQQREIGTKAQCALKLQHEQSKIQRKKACHARKEDEIQRKFELHQQKKKDRHRGK